MASSANGAQPGRPMSANSSNPSSSASYVRSLAAKLALLIGSDRDTVLAEVRGQLAGCTSKHLSMLGSKLRAAQELARVRVVGGSPTAGSGCGYGAPTGVVGKSFPRVLEDELHAAWPGASLDYDVHGGGGLGSRYYSSCLDNMVPAAADLVVLDLSLNDIEGSSEQRADVFELVLGQLEQLRVGAVLTTSWEPSPGAQSFGSRHYIGRVGRAVAANPIIYAQAARAGPRRFLCAVSPLPLLGINRSARVRVAANITRFWDGQGWHPSFYGHRLVGLHIALLLACAADVGCNATTPAATSPQPLPIASNVSRPRARAKSLCFTGPRLQAVVAPPLTDAVDEGWTFTDEGRGKWGYVGLAAHGELTISLGLDAAIFQPILPPMPLPVPYVPAAPTAAADAAAADAAAADAAADAADARVELAAFGRSLRDKCQKTSHRNCDTLPTTFAVEIGYLSSYGAEYGNLSLACRNCTCGRIKGWWPFPKVNTRNQGAHVSIWESTFFMVHCEPGHSLTLKVGQQPPDDGGTYGSKVKVLGVKLHWPDFLQ